MANSEMEISDRDFDAASARGAAALSGPVAVSAHYDAAQQALVVRLANDVFVGFPVAKLEGLQDGSADQLGHIRIEGNGLGLHWPDLDADLHVPALLEGVFGTKSFMAAQLGAMGGKAKSNAKSASSRLNGAKGGRPKKRAAKAAA